MSKRCPTCNRGLPGFNPERTHGLTERQWEYISLWAQGLKNQQVADRMCVTLKAVQWQRGAINRVWGTKSCKEIVKRAREISFSPDSYACEVSAHPALAQGTQGK